MKFKLQFFIIFLLLKSSTYAKPNILFLVVDDLRPSLQVYGDQNSYTPNINKLAAKSYLFTKAYAQQALCAPSRNSFLTSRRPDSLHLYDFYSYWRDVVGNFTTIPQFFKENGYHTYSIGKVFHPGASSNWSDDSPYSWSKKPYHPSTEKYTNAKVCVSSDGGLARNLICPIILEEQPQKILPDQQSLNAAIKYLEIQKNNSKPYFLAVGFHKPHIPFKFPSEYLTFHPLNKIKFPKNSFQPPLLPSVAWNPWTDLRKRDDIKKLNISFPFGRMPKNVTLKIIQSYHASLTYVDHLIGWSMGEHGEFAKYSNFEVAAKVPLIIRVPKLNEGHIISHELVELVDLFPTLVHLSGLSSGMQTCPKDKTVKLCTEGKSLVPLMVSLAHGQAYEGKKAIFYQYPRPGTFPTQHPNSDKPTLHEIKIMGYSIKTKQFRYTMWTYFDNEKFTPNWKKVYATELYDHLFDPEEENNLAGKASLSNLENSLKTALIKGWRYI
ncbi:iduronate 2-sulfatase isoform X2 [Agrilus planipennis]|uniref:Iduronate 2-sulfatase isoform X2 n=1 Tax=Agrilus planipennis TaxID=224129 RepID=A0A7F5R3B6_AGRPL|nr:iduronate 2-sulfatase isoform X2 [Agrilus planipennis]